MYNYLAMCGNRGAAESARAAVLERLRGGETPEDWQTLTLLRRAFSRQDSNRLGGLDCTLVFREGPSTLTCRIQGAPHELPTRLSRRVPGVDITFCRDEDVAVEEVGVDDHIEVRYTPVQSMVRVRLDERMNLAGVYTSRTFEVSDGHGTLFTMDPPFEVDPAVGAVAVHQVLSMRSSTSERAALR
jgi:hypothetical protein